MQRLKNKVAVITGGNSGIGKGIAQTFWAEGAKVVIFGRNKKTLEEANAEMNHEALVVQGDVTETKDLQNLFAQTQAKFGKIDILVANSGVGERLHVQDVTEDKFDWMVDINYRGCYFTVKYALDYLNDGASVILISSCAAHVTIKHHSVYSSTKAAVSRLAKNFASDLGHRDIRVNSISPGYIETPIFDERLKHDPTYLEQRVPMIPLKRIGNVKDIAYAAVFLSTDEASYITGCDMLIDGGITSSYPV